MSDDASAADGLEYVDCSPSSYMSMAGERQYYRLTMALTWTTAIGTFTGPFWNFQSLQVAALDLFQRFGTVSGDAVSPLLPAPAADDSTLDALNPLDTHTVTFDVVTLGNAQVLTCAELVQRIRAGSNLHVVRFALVDAESATGPGRLVNRDAANGVVEQKQKDDSALQAAQTFGKWFIAILVLTLVLGILFYLPRRSS